MKVITLLGNNGGRCKNKNLNLIVGLKTNKNTRNAYSYWSYSMD